MTSTAADKVFNIGELVEAILNNLPDSTTERQHQPLLQLFVLQSLNRKANATIRSSRTLRQHMFLEPRDSSLAATRTPMIWLLRQLGIEAVTSSGPAFFDLRIKGLGLNGTFNCKVHGYLRDCIAAFSVVEAYRSLTWVHLKIPTRGVSNRSLDMRIQIGSEYIWHFGVRPKELTRWWRDGVLNTMYAERWEFGEDTTVGDLLDKYLEVMRRNPAEHRLQQSVHLKARGGTT
ncbi:hypothetical protein DOTSEDRAFT_24874 [Dothistroma septosporum NZE10]|uniref:Uncharacterized protein n=1 Tax=Dothistroma septosporum (strain NZE10 / CBS 128990) TaxID=675120 RepID=M2XK52_DOTSN|nr:hypothetical protein DOTSEDRAFT_24874 [Dothistroma septosporum NZE10]